MFFAIEAHEYTRHTGLLDQMFRLRKRIFADQLHWKVSVEGDAEIDSYDQLGPVYLVWTDDDMLTLYGSLRMMPTTGPTLLNCVFRATFPADIDLCAPDIWEGTRLCIDQERVAERFADLTRSRALGLMLLALCECGLAFGISTMISNYEPQMRRFYRQAGLAVDELGMADGYGRFPVCCGAFEVSPAVLASMRSALSIHHPVFANPGINAELSTSKSIRAA